MQKYCPKCGAKLDSNATFCPKCGAKLTPANNTAAVKPTSTQPTSRNRQNAQTIKSPPRPPMSKKKKIIISSIVAAVVVLFGLFEWGKHYYDTTHQVTRIVNAISEKDSAKLATMVETDNKSVKINSDAVKPLIKYYDGKYSDLNMLKNTLINGGDIRGIDLVRDGNYFLFFPKYKLKVASYSATIRTNHKDSKIYVDGKYLTTAADDGTGSYVAKIGPYLGGKYNVQVKAEASGHNISSNGNLTLWNNKEYNYDIETADLAIVGPNDGQVYIGDKKVGTISDGVLLLKDYQYNSESSAYIVYKVGKNTFTSKEENISENVESSSYGDNSDYDSDDDFAAARKSTNKIGSSYVTIYPEFNAAPDLKDISGLIKDCFRYPDSDEFINGSDNKYYKSFNKLAEDFDDSDKIDNWTVEPDISSVYPIGDGVFECDAKINYKFEHEDDTHIQVAHYPHITFKQEKGSFKILSVGEGKIIYDNSKNN